MRVDTLRAIHDITRYSTRLGSHHYVHLPRAPAERCEPSACPMLVATRRALLSAAIEFWHWADDPDKQSADVTNVGNPLPPRFVAWRARWLCASAYSAVECP